MTLQRGRHVLSIVIPTLNERENLPDTLGLIRAHARGETVEIIVSDCNSRDGTAEAAEHLGATLVTGGTSRSDAMNRGAQVASGETILFLHADTKPPQGYARHIRRALGNPSIVGGAFDFRFRSYKPTGWVAKQLLVGVAIFNRIRFRHSRGFFGDQGIFIRRAIFEQLGGFPPIRLLEDLKFSLAMSRLGRTAILSPSVRTSPRRFVQRGVIRQFVQDVLILSADSFGVRPQNIWERYNAHNRTQIAARPLSVMHE